MPYSRPGLVKYVTNTSGGNIAHLAPVSQSGAVGQAIKQKAPDPVAGLVNPQQIANGEDFIVLVKGVVQVANTGITGVAKGDAVYITAANALTTTVGTNAKFGRVVSIAGQRGTPAAMVRIDLDGKDSF